ncbi:MAG: FAD-dependent oxidoreductase [Intrasporangium sp.]|uniref:NAD(P)/FAD-dependent oxidoreductase n=1 Tax=Intrasporangium sp. TaxID=1925024 RepID=UPI002647DDDC|nr:NAD(P)/FAD-dependent oxidoreductase [Intrasporangium sp.]MDN5795189.1 FAD-dependent oxidoreductase [Intrasporangium sp.]
MSTTDVLVVGAGPAGLACAATILEHSSLSVVVVDAGHGPGGQYWRQPAPAVGADALDPAELADLHHDRARFDALLHRLEQGRTDGRLQLRSQHHVWSAVPDMQGYAVHAVDRGRGPSHVPGSTTVARALVLATGAFDRALPFPGWDLPGVMTVGGLQALLKAGGVVAGRRVALGGTGPFLLPVAAGLARHGATVVGVYEANRPARWLREGRAVARNAGKLGEGAGYAAALLRHRVPVRAGRMVVAAHGADRVEAITLARLDRAGHPVPGSDQRVAVDAVGVGWGFSPQLDLAVTLGVDLTPDVAGTEVVAVDDAQRTSRPGVYAAGEVCGVGGAPLALTEGRLAAAAVVADLTDGRVPADVVSSARRVVTRQRAFATAILRAHPVPAGWADRLAPDTIVCRCEEVTLGAVRAAIDERGARDARQVKQLTRTGMGWCQGRVCGYAAALLSSGRPGPAVERLVAAPVPLGTLGALAEPTARPSRRTGISDDAM